MTGLIRAELARLRARRLTLVTALLLLLAIGLFQFAVNAAVSPPSGAELTERQQAYQQEVQDWEQNHQQEEQECIDDGGSPAECAAPRPTPQDYALEPISFAEIGNLAVLFATVFSLFASYLVAASLIGAEYGTGSLATWLSFVPQRLRVYSAKLLAVVVAGAVAAAAANALVIASAVLLTNLHNGPVNGVGRLAGMGGRGVALGALAAVVGFCVAVLTRHTVAALGLVLGYLVVANVLGGLAGALPSLAKLPPWLPDQNLQAFLQHGSTYLVPVTTTTPAGTTTDYVERHISFGHSAVYWLVFLVVLGVGTALVFRRRDVT